MDHIRSCSSEDKTSVLLTTPIRSRVSMSLFYRPLCERYKRNHRRGGPPALAPRRMDAGLHEVCMSPGCRLSGRTTSHLFGIPRKWIHGHTYSSEYRQVEHTCVTLMPYTGHRSLSVDVEDAAGLMMPAHTYTLLGVQGSRG